VAASAVGAFLAVAGAQQANDAALKFPHDPSQRSRYDDGLAERRRGLVLVGASGAALLSGLALLISLPPRASKVTLSPLAASSVGVFVSDRF
jgi:hypothetical protein